MENKEISEDLNNPDGTINTNKVATYFRAKIEYLNYAYRMYDIFNNNITPYLVERIRQNLKGEASISESLSRLSTINILPKVVNKLSRVYSTGEIEITTDRQNALENVESLFKMGTARDTANQMLNLNKCCALEPVFPDIENGDSVEEGSGFIRVLPAHQFLVYSEDDKNPEKVTHFLKIIKAKTLATLQRQDQSFAAVETYSSVPTDFVIEVYTKDSYLTMDGSGKVLTPEQENPYGVIPFVYLKRDTVDLLPRTGRDDYEMVTLLPLLLTDSNFALKFQAFSILYILNANAKDMDLGPNAIWFLESNGQEGDKPEIGSIKPTLSTEDVIKNLSLQYSLWLETKNLKSTTMTSQGASSVEALSGIAKAIDEADVTDDIEKQKKIFAEAERNLLHIIGRMGESFLRGVDLDTGKVAITFKESSVIPETPTDKLDRLLKKLDSGLITKMSAIMEANGIEDEELAKKLMKEIAMEREDVQANNETGAETTQGFESNT